MAIADQFEVLNRDIRNVEKALAVHLAECTASHKAVDLKMDEMKEALDSHARKTEEYRNATAGKISATQKLIVAGIVISALLQGMNSQDLLKVLSALIKVYFP